MTLVTYFLLLKYVLRRWVFIILCYECLFKSWIVWRDVLLTNKWFVSRLLFSVWFVDFTKWRNARWFNIFILRYYLFFKISEIKSILVNLVGCKGRVPGCRRSWKYVKKLETQETVREELVKLYFKNFFSHSRIFA